MTHITKHFVPHLTTHEVEVLRAINGESSIEWGARVGACLEYLSGNGYATKDGIITSRGKEYLSKLNDCNL
jgi:hypothetical protein